MNKGAFYVLCVCTVALCAILTVQSGLLLLLHNRPYNKFLITGMHFSRIHKLVIVMAHMADTDLQNAQIYVKQLNQHPAKEAYPMLCSTLDGWVCYLNAVFLLVALL